MKKADILQELWEMIPMAKRKNEEVQNRYKELADLLDPPEQPGILPKLDRPLCFVDLETTGVDPLKDKIVEICILKVMPDGTEEIRTRRINPGRPIPKEATEVHGITDEMVKKEPTFNEISKGIFNFLDGCDIVGFNSNRFDAPMLFYALQGAGIRWDWKQIRLIDVRNIYVQKEERTLSAAVKFYLGRDHEEAHSAEGDIIATKEVFLKQLAMYPDLKSKTLDEVAFFSNYEKETVDMSNVFSKNAEGVIILNIGKSKGLPAVNDKGFLGWMLGKPESFAPDTLEIANQLYKQR